MSRLLARPFVYLQTLTWPAWGFMELLSSLGSSYSCRYYSKRIGWHQSAMAMSHVGVAKAETGRTSYMYW
jgi:hypothetical protein